MNHPSVTPPQVVTPTPGALHANAGAPISARFHLLCCLGYTFLCLGWNAWAGRDQSWDQINYHLYVAHAWWHNRLPDELFAASAQGYLNPLPHLPFYAAYSTGWHSLLVSTLMAALHSTNLWLLHFIGVELTRASNRLRRTMIVGGALLGGLTPAFLIETGTSFTDVIVSIPSLAALLSLFYWLRRCTETYSCPWSYLWLAGLLAGFATGLKPSALVFAAAMGLSSIVVARTRAWTVAWRAILAGLLGLALGGGAHALMLWRAFGNPVFPLFNKIFHSPWFQDENVVSERFRPASLIDALRYPLDLADAFKRVGFESIAADIRPITLLGLLVAASLAALIRGKGNACKRPVEVAGSRLFWLTLATFFPAWIYTSGNTRYAVQGLLLLGPAIAWISARLPGRSPILPMLALGLPLAAQGTAALTLNASRWNVRPWSQAWLALDIPQALRSRPAYYLSLQTQSYSALATVLPPDSRFTNLVGQNTQDPEGPVWQQVRRAEQAQSLPWRSLYAVPVLIETGGVPLDSLDIQDALLSEYGLRTDRSDCQWIVLDGAGQPALRWARIDARLRQVREAQREVIISCALHEAPPPSAEETARRRQVDMRMSRWEVQCPKLFAPAHTHSEQLPTQRRRMYVSTDTLLIESDGQLTGVSIHSGYTVRLEDRQGRRLVAGCPPMPQWTNDQSPNASPQTQ